MTPRATQPPGGTSAPGLSPCAHAGERRARDRAPAIAALLTAVAGAVNVASVLTADLPERLRGVLTLAPAGEVRVAHALALPLGLALLALAWPLARRRRRALRLAVVLLVLLGVIDLVKGLDVEEAIVSWAIAFGLVRARSAFWVRHERAPLGEELRRAVALLGSVVLAGTAVVALVAGHATAPLPLRDCPNAALRLLALSPGPDFRSPFSWVPLGLGLLGAGAVLLAAARVLAPLRPGGAFGGRAGAAALIRRHGTDTLSAFKLRGDLQRRWTADGETLAAFRVEAGTLLLAGDPVGPRHALPGALAELRGYARAHGLAFGVVGASESFAALAAESGVKRMYLGDEALLDAGALDLSGRPRRKLRQGVSRVARHGIRAEVVAASELDPATLAGVRAVNEAWLDGGPERGFSMAHDALVDPLLPDALLVLARDEDDHVRGFLHFVPVFGRPAMSLGFMRREPEAPNGLMEFLVVESARLLGERGVEELSLNFAAFGGWLRAPERRHERILGWLMHVADRWFQVERLLRFNAKFEPRWQPRYLLFEHRAQLPRVALAAMWAEGQLPRPSAARPARYRAEPVPVV